VTFSENRALYELMWKNMVQADMTQMAVCYGASTLRKATNKRSEYVIFIACPLQLWLRERVSMLRLQAYCLSCSITLHFIYFF
jgi:hypothetical protein